MNEVCKKLERKRQKKGYWETANGLKEIHDIASAYSSRSDFKYNHPELYVALRRAGALDEVCSHMDYAGAGFDSTSTAILYVLEVTSLLSTEVLTKIGISNHDVNRRYLGEKASIRIVAQWHFEFGGNARDAETLLKREMRDLVYRSSEKILSTGGNSEVYCVTPSAMLPRITRVAEEYGGMRISN